MNKDNIEDLAVKCGFYIHETKHGTKVLIANPDKELYDGYFSVKEELEAFAKALQGDVGEPVGYISRNYKKHLDDHAESTLRAFNRGNDLAVYTSPPNTSAKLDKAIEALKQARANITWTDGSRAYYKLVGLIDEALKELE